MRRFGLFCLLMMLVPGQLLGQSLVPVPAEDWVFPNILPGTIVSGPQFIQPIGGSFVPKEFFEAQAQPQTTLEGQPAGSAAGGGQSDNGTNPAVNATTAIVSNEFYHLLGGNEINTTYVRLKFPFMEKRGSLLVEVPYKFYDITEPIQSQVGGLGDVKLQLSYNAIVSDNRKFTLLTFMEFYIPSADNVLLNRIPDSNQFTATDVGSGKFVLGPGLGVVYAFAPNFIFAPLYFFERSVAGDDTRPEVNRGKLRVFTMYAFENGFYLLPEAQLVSNFKTGNQDCYLAPEMGYSTKGATFYIKPGWGVNPDTNDRSWGIECGIRVIF